MPEKRYYIYILTNFTNSTLYVGITNNLVRRVYEHKNKLIQGFTSRYNLNKLVYYESCCDSLVAINREKQLKSGPRQRKIDLIKSINPDFKDLYNDII